MIKALNLIKKYKKYAIIIGVVIVLALIYLIFGRGASGTEAFTVVKSDISQSVVLSGKVQTTDRADLGFAASGRVSRVFIKNNQTVAQGAVLAQLEIGDLLADLHIKQANNQTSNTDLDNAKQNLEKVTESENIKVANAERTLFSEDLKMVPHSTTYNLTAPTISGTYNGKEGQYQVFFNRTRSDLRLRVATFGAESSDQEINYEGQTPLGNKGLYISFPVKDPTPYENSQWTIDIPNKGGNSYLANYNAYNSAVVERDLAIKNAQADYDKLLSRGDNGNTAAQSEIEKINAEIRKNTIYAPFSGKVTNIEKQVGENASVGERVISILGENKLQVVLQVSELDVSRLVTGTPVTLKLDALPNEEFTGTLETINSRDTQIDGVPVYEAFVDVNPDPRIKTGMTATGTITLASKSQVLAIPSYYVQKVGDKNIVKVSQNGKTVEREVTLGLVGTDSMVEVLSGLSEGEKILTTLKK